MALSDLRRAGQPILLLSVDPACGPCVSLLPEMAQWQQAHGKMLGMVLLSRGSADLNRRKLGSHAISPVLLQQKQEVAERYQALATPSAVLIGADGHIAAPLAVGPDEIRRLVERTVRAATRHPQGLPVGTPAPPVNLADLDGAVFRLEERFGQPTVFLFWNPGCGFCSRMLPDLRRWESRLGGGDGDLILVSTGTLDANRAMGLQSRVLVGEGLAVAQRYGASGTPSAVLVRDGQVASELAVGAPAVLGLLGQLSPAAETAP